MSLRQRRAFLQQVGAGALAGTALSGLAPGTVADARPVPKRIKVGQIGVGHPHASKLAVYRKSPDYEVVGVVEPDAALRKRAEGQALYRGLRWMTQAQLLEV